MICLNSDTNSGKAASDIQTDGYLIVCAVYFKLVGSEDYPGMYAKRIPLTATGSLENVFMWVFFFHQKPT